MSSSSRVYYRERQRLRANDLEAEQKYLLGVAGRHYIGPHGWGVVRGLTVQINNSIATLHPGVATDGYGRELIVSQPVQLNLVPNAATQHIYLFYCERPQGACGADHNPRWKDSIAIVVQEDLLAVPEEESNLLSGRAAGSLPDEPLWPVLLGDIKAGAGNVLSVDISDVRYARIHAGPVRHSTGRTAMRVGQESLADPYHFRVVSHGANGISEDRLAFDRDGNAQFWKDLIIVGASKSATINTPIAGVKINSQLKSGLGAEVQFQTSNVVVNGEQFLKVVFQGKTSLGQNLTEELLIPNNIQRVGDLNVKLKEFTDTSQLVTLAKTGKILSARSRRGVDSALGPSAGARPKLTSTVVDDRPSRFEFGPGKIRFERETRVTQHVFCGCADSDEEAGRLREGLVFHPGPKPPVIPSKDIYNIRIAEPNLEPVDNLRIVGGPLRKGDLNRRLIIGDSNKTGSDYVFRPWFAVRGNGAIEIPGGRRDALGTPFVMLAVTGLVELAPIKPDPRDPLFNALSVLAFINGVLSLGSQLLKLTITNAPAFVETSQPWSYNIAIKNETNEDLTTVPGNSEILTAGPRSFLRAVPGVTGLGPQATSAALPVNHTPADVPLDPAATEVVIDVRIAMAGRVTIGGARQFRIPVVLSPEINGAIPATLPNNSLPQDFPITIENLSGQHVTILTAQATGATIQPAQALPRGLNPNTSLAATLTIPPQAAPVLLTVIVEITYRWEASGPTLTLARRVDIDVT